MKPAPDLSVVPSWNEFDCLVQDAGVVVAFTDKNEEAKYEKSDWRLHARVCAVLGIADSPFREDGLAYVVEDWFPNKSKFVEADLRAIAWPQLLGLYELLDGEYRDWRINLQLYRAFDSGAPVHLGGVQVYGDRILTHKDLAHLLPSYA